MLQASRCNHGDETSTSSKAMKCLGQQGECQVLKTNSAAMSLAVRVPLLAAHSTKSFQTPATRISPLVCLFREIIQ
jgi:hypothetical protein